jgi:hypothetical protein
MINQQLVVIPAQAGIHVFQGLEWTPDFSGVTAPAQYCYFEIGSIYKLLAFFVMPEVLSRASILR